MVKKSPHALVFKFIFGLVISFTLCALVSGIKDVMAAGEYSVYQFKSEIHVNQDTTIDVTEYVSVVFNQQRHGIYRVIPVIYSSRGKTINSRIRNINVVDEDGNPYKFEKLREKQSVNLKIGDPDEYVEGNVEYVISYTLDGIIQRYDDHDEFYWNVTGQWDSLIAQSSASVVSPYADVRDAKCYTGSYRETSSNCEISIFDQGVSFEANDTTGLGQHFTVVVALEKDNDLIFPSFLEKLITYSFDNWGYLASIVPFIVIIYFWYKHGRDVRYVSENIYFKPDDKSTRKISMFSRRHIPFVYHPIDNLTPSEAGTIIDERVHISDVVAEILELARLGFLKIRKLERKKLFGSQSEYAFVKTNKYRDKTERSKLRDYQEYLLKELFRSTAVHKSVKLAEKYFKDDDAKLNDVRKMLTKSEYVLLGGLKEHFYEGLPVFRKKLYNRMKEEKLFDGDPEKVRIKWVGIYILINMLCFVLLMKFLLDTYNPGPLFVFGFGVVFGLIIALRMPRRTADGYSYFRQIEGLKYYLGKGKWRHEVNEKNLFIEEILPLAVALGVVDKITDDMAELGMKPPSYFAGSSIKNFGSDFGTFYKSSASSMISTPSPGPSGRSSWSGGSGFSGGGFSGGGFGGGGGGSW